ncbi:hypothetical protein AJ78_04587 [Emergomyces pasteurianus Ep9510]|uniref:Uncharacterized protein n=1 Tax=Emergomyces pasteurianus Ep9510 TaxID=1447872 RepID=A0A1J9PGU3_9EURO|nr:hypothetical protein AJ78_04587 [Emergomyces pasteurianus Ep9510]
MRFSRLLCCGGPDDDGDRHEKKTASPPPEYHSIEGNRDAAKQFPPALQPRTISFYISPLTKLANDRDGNMNGVGAVDINGKGKKVTDNGDDDGNNAAEELKNQDVNPTGRIPSSTFLMPNGQVVTLSSNDDFVQATLAAAQAGDQALDQWLALGYGIKIRDSRNWTTVSWAVHQNQPEALHRLIARGAEIDLTGSQGYTELHRAVSGGKDKLIAALLEYGADVNVTDNDGNTPLHCALNHWLKTDKSEDFSIVKRLVEKGADLQAHNRYGNTVLHEACIYSDGMPLRYLPGYSGPSPAITYRRLAMAETLLGLGIPVDTRDKWGSTPLMRCCTMQAPDRDVIALLLDKGADANAPNNNGDTPLDAVCFQRDTELLKQVATRVIDTITNHTDDDDNFNDKSNKKKNKNNNNNNKPNPSTTALFNKPTVLSTPLHYAAQHSGPDRLLFLLSHGANPRTPTYATGATPLHLLSSSKPITTDRPISPSPSFNSNNNNNNNSNDNNKSKNKNENITPIDHITQNIHLLTSHGADINARDLTGATPLHYAARNVESRHQERIVAALLAAGAEPDCKDSKGRTPLRELKGYWVLKGAVVKRLVDAGAEKVPEMEGLGGFEYMDRDGMEG